MEKTLIVLESRELYNKIRKVTECRGKKVLPEDVMQREESEE